MVLPIKHFSFTQFATGWANGLSRHPSEVAQSVAQAIVSGQLKWEFFDPSYVDHYGLGDDPRLEAYIIDVVDHLARVARGLDAPDLAERLRYVTLATTDLESWLRAENCEVPHFMRAATGSENAAGA
jgi:hypothetical protein